MKKKIFVLLIVLLLLLAITTPVFAGTHFNNWAQYCKYHAPDAYVYCLTSPARFCHGFMPSMFKNHGACVSWFMTEAYDL
ncbi:MAG: hypothetical protein ABFS17_04995 [Chloroflexota bacterium]